MILKIGDSKEDIKRMFHISRLLIDPSLLPRYIVFDITKTGSTLLVCAGISIWEIGSSNGYNMNVYTKAIPYGAHGFGFKTWNRVLFFYINS